MIAILGIIGPLLGGLGGLSAIGLGAIPFVGPLFKFFGSGAGKIVGLALLAVTIYGVGWFKGDAHGDAQCVVKLDKLNTDWRDRVDAAADAFAKARQARDAEIDLSIDKLVQERIAATAGEQTDLKKLVDEYAAELAKRPKADASCAFGPDDVGLRNRAKPRR
jgi:hypothetical protein